MSEAVNEDSEERIKDTKQFFDQMVELEELAASKMDKRLAALSSIAGDVGTIRKNLIAKQADDLAKKLLEPEELEFQKQITKVVDATENNAAFQEGQALGEINRDNTLGLGEKLDLSMGIIPREQLDGKVLEHVAYPIAMGRPKTVHDLLNRYNASAATSQEEFTTKRRQALNAVYRTAIFNWIASGGDPTDKRFQRKLFETVLPVYNKELDLAQDRFLYDLEKTQQNERTRVIDTRLTKSVLTKQSNFYGPDGIIAQVKAELNLSKPEAEDYVYKRVGHLVSTGTLTPQQGQTIMDELPFTPDGENGKTYKSKNIYLESIQNKDSVFYANASGRAQRLSKIITEKQIELDKLAVDTSNLKAKEFEIKEINPLIADSVNGTLETSQIKSLYEEFVDPDGFYIEGETKIPTSLQSMHNKTHTGGVRDKQVLLVDEFANQINEAVDGIELLYRQKQTLEAGPKLGKTDSNAVKRLQAEFLKVLYGENGKELEAVKMAIGQNQYTFDDKVREIEADLLKRFDAIIAEPPIKPLGESVRAALELRNQVSENPDLLYSKTALEGEDVNRLFDYLNTGGERNKDLGMFYKNARFKIVEDGQVKVLSGYEAAEVRGKELGLYDQKDKKLMNFNAKILKDYKLVNDVENKTTAQKVSNVFFQGDPKKLKDFLIQHAINRSGGTSQAEDDGYSFTRAGGSYDRTGLTGLSGQQLVNLAKSGSTDFGRYKLSKENILELDKEGRIDYSKPFTEDRQSKAVLDIMALNTNRQNSISGAVTEETKNFRKLSNFTLEENEVIKQIFPNLSKNYFAQFSTLDREVANLLLSDLERYQKNLDKLLAEDKAKEEAEKLRRSKLSKRELRGR